MPLTNVNTEATAPCNVPGRGRVRRGPLIGRVAGPLGYPIALTLLILLSACVPIAAGAQEGIYRVRPTGGTPERIAPQPAIPVWSPDGDRVAWADDDGVWVAAPDGADAKLLLSIRRGGPPRWHPTGGSIAVVDAEQRLVLVSTLEGIESLRIPLFADQESDFAAAPLRNAPVWAPDGSGLAFTSWDGNGTEIFAVDADGTGRRQVSHLRSSAQPIDGEQPTGPTKAVSDALRPSWSPLGGLIAFAVVPELRGAPGGVYVADTRGQRQTRLTARTPAFGPLWSPDGRSLLFIHRADRDTDLFLIDLSARIIRNLSDQSDLVPRDAAWSPDGRRIVFSADGALYLLDVASEAIQPLADTPLVDLSPAWSPDGEWIAFRAEADRFVQPALPPLP